MDTTEGRLAFWMATAGVVLAGAVTAWVIEGSLLLDGEDQTTVWIAGAVPLTLAAAIWGALHLACRRRSRGWRAVGLIVAWTLTAFSWVTGFSIGMLVLPAAALLLVAAFLTPADPRRPPTDVAGRMRDARHREHWEGPRGGADGWGGGGGLPPG